MDTQSQNPTASQNTPTVKPVEATKPVITKKGASLKNLVASFAPEGIDTETYYTLISTQIMGVDARGKGRPIEDMLFFLNVAKKLQLDPTLRQIYPVYRWDSRLGRERMIIQTGIDGFRLVAQRSRQYGGQDDPTYKVEEIFDPITGENKKQLVAIVTVYKMVNNERMPVTASARWHEYAQKKSNGEYMGMWVTMPYNQLGKCAEALALRKAFPQDLSGVYISEEMDKERGDVKSLNLPTPKSIEEKKAKALESAKAKEIEAKKENVKETAVKEEKKVVEPQKAQETLLKNFSGMKQSPETVKNSDKK